jgi:hypothetical protein
MGRRKKLIKIRKPKLRITPKGVKITNPSARIGGKIGLNISKSGVSGSARTKLGTVSTGRSTKHRSCLGCTGCALNLIALPALLLFVLYTAVHTDRSK